MRRTTKVPHPQKKNKQNPQRTLEKLTGAVETVPQPTKKTNGRSPRWKLSAAAMITSTCGFVPGQVVTTQGGRPRVTGTRGVDVEMGSTFIQGAKW